MELFIRTEANETTASGHMTRCLSVAEAARKTGAVPVFIVAEEVSAAMPREKGFETIVLNRIFDDYDNEIAVMAKLVEKRGIKTLLIDSYWVTEKYVSAMTKLTNTAYFDDLHEKIWDVDILINYAVNAKKYSYEKEYKGTKLLLGCDYMPLRGEYNENLPEKIINDEVKNILVVSGGADEPHFLYGLTRRLKDHGEFAGITFTVITGRFNNDHERIEEISKENSSDISLPHIRVCRNLPSLKDELLNADICISAGGTTLYELAATGTPGICCMIADNQRDNVEGFSSKGLLEYAGDVREEGFFKVLFEKLTYLKEKKDIREKMSAELKRVVDGKGAARIASAITDKIL
ncbi:MAG: UDP-2,4-diacetamido-2,4,6-trideoxy-beta-L-altropyranose hydrolase [Lachnospiraceae bacterium]|nr:UDP-2,4-diacetamido-2,4,6-trideoxy-beta-L-altropyranose hydrolase [Lachnospiraceae bacterium]